jgi:hypothetical protein
VVAEPEPGYRLMERPRLLQEPGAPASLVVYPVRSEDADDLFDTVVDSVSNGRASRGTRVFKTVSRRIR